MSEEKKLTDEELKQAFFILRHGSSEGLSEYIKSVLAIESECDRQKTEIETLKSELRKECEEHEEFTKQAKAEIERLKDVNAGLALANLCDLPPNEDCLTDNEFEIARKTIAEQKAEIERLTERAERAAICEKEYLEWATGFLKTRFDIKDWFTNPEHQRTPCTYEFFASTLWEKIKSAMSWLYELEEREETLRKENSELQKQVDEYKAKIEQGTLIELPCEVGDTVWEVSPFSKMPTAITAPNIHTILRWKEDEAFGSELFLTYEEAEKRLKELQNG